MKFSTRQDIDAPIEFAFAHATDFVSLEMQALRRGIEVARLDDLPDNVPGLRWSAALPFRGKIRKLRAELATYAAPDSFSIQSVSGGIEADFDVEFLSLSREQTRVKVGLELSPKTLSARLMIQSLKFAKARLDTRFASRVGGMAKEIGGRYQRQQTRKA